jgi:hypothetical protein
VMNKQNDILLSDIKRQLSRVKTEVTPLHGFELCKEVQSHLNRVMADVAESARPREDVDYWAGTVYGKHSSN